MNYQADKTSVSFQGQCVSVVVFSILLHFVRVLYAHCPFI